MPVFESEIDPRSERFAKNRADHLKLIEGFRALEQKIIETSARAKPKFEKRGQLLPRERLALVLDRGAPFVELSTLCGYKMHDDDGDRNISGGGGISGVGFVAGVRCVISASDSGIKGGAATPMGVHKALRAQALALENKLPFVQLIESAGANLMRQAEMFVPGGRTFANLARLSAAGCPVISVVHGSSTAGGAYQTGLSDYVVAVRGKSKIFLAGPPLLKAATGEIATDEDLGGAEMHYHVSGLAEYMAEDDGDGVRIAREIVSKLGWDRARETKSFDEPLYGAEDLLGIVPMDYRQPYDSREVIARLVDGSDMLGFKDGYGPATVCTQAAIAGHQVGMISNNGPIDADGAAKVAQFIQLMEQAGSPVVFLQNTTGYLVGTDAEQRGIVKHGSKMIQAVTNMRVPKLTLHIGASFGAGNYGMCGRAFDPRFIFAWPNNRIAVMGGEQAAKTMRIVAEEGARKKGEEPNAEFLDGMAKHITEQYDAESTALFATARLWDDGLIDPRDSRKILAFCLDTVAEAEWRELRPNVFGVARMQERKMKLTTEHDQIRKMLKSFIEAEINPYVEEWEEAGGFPAHKVFKGMGQLGLLGVTKAEQYGGMGLDWSYGAVVAEALGHINCGGVPMAIGVQTDMATPALARFGTDEAKEDFLKPSIAGDYVACLGVSEVGAGSDVASIKTTAKKDGEDYVINGGKMWTTSGTQADWMCLLANTGDGPVHQNKTLICLPLKDDNGKHRDGVTVARKLKKLGMRSSDTAEFFFEDVRVPQRYRIGEEGAGFMYQMMQFQEERLWCALSSLLSLDNTIDETAEYARQRKAFGKSILDNQVVHFRLAELKTEVQALRSMSWDAVEKMMEGEDVVMLASMAKLKAGRLAREVNDACLQYWGGMGFMEETPVSRAYRDGRLGSIGGGADEVMLSIICKYMGTLPGKSNKA